VATAQTIVVPHIGAGSAWTDNIELTPPGETKDAQIWQLLPGIYLKHDSQSFHGTLDYELQQYWYGGSEHGHSTLQQGILYTETQLAQDWLFVDLGGSIGQSVVDPSLSPALSNGLFPTGNVANESLGAVTPIVRHKFGAVQLLAQYSWGFVHYQPVGTVAQTLPDAENQDGTFRLGSVDKEARITWDAAYLRQQTTYKDNVAPRWLYESAIADLGWLVTPTVRLLGQGGKESDLTKNVSAGGLTSSLWSAGFDWNPDELTEVRFTAGRRYFGNSYTGLIRHQSRLLTLQASYSETPTTNASRQQPQAPPQDLVTIPGVPTFQRVTSDVYVNKLLDARAALTGRLTEVGLDLIASHQDYITLNGVPATTPVSDQFRSATLYLTRRLGAQLQAVLDASFSHSELREIGEVKYDDRHFVARLDDQLGLRTTLTLQYDYWQRSGSQVFKVNMVTLKANMTFGNGPTGGFPNAPIVAPAAPAPAVPAQVTPPYIMPGRLSAADPSVFAAQPAEGAAFPAAP
jgi:hypothetical protein